MDESSTHQSTFTFSDYIIFFATLLVSTTIGVYFGCFGSKQTSASEYMFGKKKMKALPIALSVITCQFSGISMLGVPAEVYLYGIGHLMIALSAVLGLWCSYKVILPVMAHLNVNTPYEYLDLRFNKSVYLLNSLLSILIRVLTSPIVIYAPALALSQCTGFNINYITPVICIVCIFYTTPGGFKAVVWTDSFQFISMFASAVVVSCLGTLNVGGVSNIINSSLHSERLHISFDVSPTTHNTFWSTVVGMFFFWIYFYGLDQCCVQKFLSLSDPKQTKRAYMFVAAGVVIFFLLSVYIGLILYALYKACDPLKNRNVSAPEQILPYFILNNSKANLGLSGLFIACVFNASLSSLSVYLNSISCIIYNDFVKKLYNTSTNNPSNVIKLIVLLVGLVETALVYVIERVDTIVQLNYTILGATSGTEVGVFVLGMLVPFGNSKGALFGYGASLLSMLWIMIGSYFYKINKCIVPYSKQFNISNYQDWHMNETLITDVQCVTRQPLYIYRVSSYYYPLMGTAIVLLVGVPVSWFTKKSSTTIDRNLLSPIAARWASVVDSNDLNRESVPLQVQ